MVGADALLKGEEVSQSMGERVGDKPVLDSPTHCCCGDESAPAKTCEVV